MEQSQQWAGAIDSIRRKTVLLRAMSRMVEIPGGFITLHPPSRDEPFASANKNAMHWYAPGRILTSSDIAAATAVLRQEQLPRAFAWLGPGTWDYATEEALRGAGAQHVPWVTYPVLARSTAEMPCDADPASVETRALEGVERESFLQAIAPWYSEGGATAAGRMAAQGFAELHGAWVDGKPAAMAALIRDGNCGYLGWAGTDPSLRKKGCQSALIRCRVQRARGLGLAWCLSETVTADMTSTNNLLRAGFTEGFAWKVWEWKRG